MTTEELTENDVIAKLKSFPEPLREKVKTIGVKFMTPIERDIIQSKGMRI
jgi:hypothetical protein